MLQTEFVHAALAAATRGWSVFPLVAADKTPAISGWEQRATTDRRQLGLWWASDARRNVGVATGKSGLVVVDLDSGGGGCPPARFAGAEHGRDVLAMLAAEADAELPTDTYTVQTPGGYHLYFRAPTGLRLRNTTGRLGWHIDTRAHGGYVVAAGSCRPEGGYRLMRAGPVAWLPAWLREALAPAPPAEPGPPMRLPRRRAGAYLRAILDGEARRIGSARVGTRHDALLTAARTLGRLVGGGELAEDDARHTLLTASGRHIGVEGCTAAEVARTVEDGITYGKRLPRHITDGPGNRDQTKAQAS